MSAYSQNKTGASASIFMSSFPPLFFNFLLVLLFHGVDATSIVLCCYYSFAALIVIVSGVRVIHSEASIYLYIYIYIYLDR